MIESEMYKAGTFTFYAQTTSQIPKQIKPLTPLICQNGEDTPLCQTAVVSRTPEEHRPTHSNSSNPILDNNNTFYFKGAFRLGENVHLLSTNSFITFVKLPSTSNYV